MKFIYCKKARSDTRVYLKWQVVLLPGCSVDSASVSRVLVKYSGKRCTSEPASQGKINLAEGGIFRLFVIGNGSRFSLWLMLSPINDMIVLSTVEHRPEGKYSIKSLVDIVKTCIWHKCSRNLYTLLILIIFQKRSHDPR
jgi:hypothetical protein